MSLAEYEKKYFSDKTKSVLDQLELGYSGYEVERSLATRPDCVDCQGIGVPSAYSRLAP